MKGARTRKGDERPQNAPVERFAARRPKPAERAGAGRQMRSICESPSGRAKKQNAPQRGAFCFLLMSC